MANFKGHALPGSCFLLLGMWWSVKYPLRHCWKRRQPRDGQKLPPLFKRMDLIEGVAKIFLSFVGIMAEQFVPDGPHAQLFDHTTDSWVKLMNWQHSTMYLFFGISGIADVVQVTSHSVPVGVDRLTLSIALFIEGFLFYFHVHDRAPLDAHIHSLLLFAVFAASASTLVEVFLKEHIVLELLRACLTILQGSWFFQIGFVLYPLNGVEWDLKQHGNIMFITMCFCWHLSVAMMTVVISSLMVWGYCICSGYGHEVYTHPYSTNILDACNLPLLLHDP